MVVNRRIQPKSLKSDLQVLAPARKEVEAQIGTSLPDSLIDLLGNGSHAITFEEGIEIKPLQPNPLARQEDQQVVLIVLGLSGGSDWITKAYDQYKKRLEAKYTPIAKDDFSNLFMLHATKQEILFWYHECQKGKTNPEAFTLDAKNFDQFLSNLQPEADLKSKADSPNVSGLKRLSFDFLM